MAESHSEETTEPSQETSSDNYISGTYA